ncbi:MAG: hypothetical protein SFV52_01325 [Saprospiraceae bacterium]|nr:hypothetical protein [Saprospiraceae bacterium]
MKRILFSIAATLLFSAAVYSQREVQYGFAYSMGFPGSKEFKDFVDKPSFAGFNFSVINYRTSQLGLGFSIGWNDFYQQDKYTTIQYNDATTVTGTFRHNIYFTTVLFNSRYRFLAPERLDAKGFEASVGLDPGLYFMTQRGQVSIYYDEETRTLFGLNPSIGGIYRMNNIGIQARARYHIMIDGGSSQFVTVPNYFSVDVGIVFLEF